MAEQTVRLFDSHAHYNDRRFDAEFEGGGRGALLRARSEGVERICTVGSSVSSSEESIRLAEEFDFVVAFLLGEDAFCERLHLDEPLL